MLQMDLARSCEELAGEVGERCSALGQVIKVTAYPARSGASARPFAIVSMALRLEAESVAATFGGRTVGNSVVIFLEATAEAAVRPAAAPPGTAAGNSSLRAMLREST
ncbi:MAG TPA: hypothetical protein VKF40_13290 [Burkholderiales bacterium]|nr:hypothetical protein [Burkholderiales bacterium]